MKKTIYLFGILLIFVSVRLVAQTTLETQLRNFPITKYLNKPIDTLIANLPAGYDTAFEIGSTSSINKGASLQINYPNCQYWVYINITDAKYITVNKNTRNISYAQAWPLSLLRKEKVGSVTIYTGAYEIINEADIY
jgi:hypothetical protein